MKLAAVSARAAIPAPAAPADIASAGFDGALADAANPENLSPRDGSASARADEPADPGADALGGRATKKGSGRATFDGGGGIVASAAAAPDASAAILALLNAPAAATNPAAPAASAVRAGAPPSSSAVPPSAGLSSAGFPPADLAALGLATDGGSRVAAGPSGEPLDDAMDPARLLPAAPGGVAAAIVDRRSHIAPAPAGTALNLQGGSGTGGEGGSLVSAPAGPGPSAPSRTEGDGPGGAGGPGLSGIGPAPPAEVGERPATQVAAVDATSSDAVPVLRSIVDAVSTLAEQAPAASAAPATAGSAPVPAIARTLVLQLSPASLGTVDVRLHVTGAVTGGAASGGLDVDLALSDRQALGLVSRERDVLAQALRSGGYELHSLVVRGSDAAQGAGLDHRSGGDGSASDQRAADQGRPGAGFGSSTSNSMGNSTGGRGGDRGTGEQPAAGGQGRRQDGAHRSGAIGTDHAGAAAGENGLFV